MYSFVYRRRISLFKTTLKGASGHSYDPTLDKMWIAFASGGGREIMRWKECEAFLGSDWQQYANRFTKKIGRPVAVV